MNFIVFSKYLRNYEYEKWVYEKNVLHKSYMAFYILYDIHVFKISNFSNLLSLPLINFAKFKNFVWTKIKKD